LARPAHAGQRTEPVQLGAHTGALQLGPGDDAAEPLRVDLTSDEAGLDGAVDEVVDLDVHRPLDRRPPHALEKSRQRTFRRRKGAARMRSAPMPSQPSALKIAPSQSAEGMVVKTVIPAPMGTNAP